MAKVILICGKLCSGKSTYAAQLRKENGGVILSVDEIMLALFGQHAGEKHDDYVKSTKKILLEKAAQCAEAGVTVLLDWGFWTKAEREGTKAFFGARNISCALHYLDISGEVWKQRLEKRNRAIAAGESDAYYVDENLAKKFDSIFEMPGKEEIDLWLGD